MKNKSLKYIKNAFEMFAERHKMINGFKFGFYDNEPFGDVGFPLLSFSPESVSIDRGEMVISLNMAILDQDTGNTLDILSSLAMIVNDFKAYYFDCRGNEEGLEIADAQALDPISFEYEQVLSGYETTIQIRLPYTFDRSVIPMEIEKSEDFTAKVFGKYRVKTGDNDVNVTNPVSPINGDVFTIIPDDEDGNNTLYVDGQDLGAQHGESIVFRYNRDHWEKI